MIEPDAQFQFMLRRKKIDCKKWKIINNFAIGRLQTLHIKKLHLF